MIAEEFKDKLGAAVNMGDLLDSRWFSDDSGDSGSSDFLDDSPYELDYEDM